MTPAEIISAAIDRLGPSGERWAGHGMWGPKDECMYVALHKAGRADFKAFMRAWKFVSMECGGSVIAFNDEPRNAWLDIALVLKRALARAEVEER